MEETAVAVNSQTDNTERGFDDEEERESVALFDFRMAAFTLAGKDYAIDIMHVKEIVKASRFTYVPNTAPFVLGVYNLRGEIIPKIVGLVAHEDDAKNCKPIVFPKKCSVCGAELLDTPSRLYCPNKACPKRVLHQIFKWIECSDIRDLGDSLVNALFNDKKLRSISDIYSLDEAALTPYFLNQESIEKEKDSLGAKNVVASIKAHSSLSLAQFIAGFDIEGIGEQMVEKVIEGGFDSLEKLLSATPEEFEKVYGFAQITAAAFAQGLAENAAEMRSLAKSGAITIKEKKSGALAGLSFCFTGELKTMKRADAEALVKEKGGSAKSSVTKDLSYLVTNDKNSGSGKNAKAAKFGIQIIDEDEFLRLVK